MMRTFLKRHAYDKNLLCLGNPLLSAMIRGLDLSLETRGNVPNERIVLGFAHDTMKKNHYLMKAIKRQLIIENKDYDGKAAGILGTKYC